MSVRIEIELTSSTPDGAWTWRAAGAREPRGVLDGSILPAGAAVGDQLRVETEHDVDGIHVLSVVAPKEKSARTDLLELLPTDERFEPVVQHRAPGGRGDGARRPRRDRGERGERPERDGDRRDRRERQPADGPGRGGRAATADHAGRGERGPDQGDRGERRDGQGRASEDRRRRRPHFTPPPEVPQRPKPKRLRPGKQHRNEVLASTPEEQRMIAELALQGLPAVRQRLREDNARLRAEGKPEMPEGAVLKMAEALLPRLRVADWLDRAEAAQRQLEHLDLRDLRSVVAASDDPLVARDESTRTLAMSLKAALASKQEEELTLWLADVEAALDVGRVVRALRLSAMPPKAGVPFPGALANRLADTTTASLQPADGPDRWSAVLEAVAFSPVRTLVSPASPPEQRSDELLATVRRLAPLLPQIAALFGIEVPERAPTPKPLRPATRRPDVKKQSARPAAPPRPAGTAPEAAPEPAPPAEEEAEPVAAASHPEAETATPASETAPVIGDVQAEPSQADATPSGLASESGPATVDLGASAFESRPVPAQPEATPPPSEDTARPVPEPATPADAEPAAADSRRLPTSFTSGAADSEPARLDAASPPQVSESAPAAVPEVAAPDAEWGSTVSEPQPATDELTTHPDSRGVGAGGVEQVRAPVLEAPDPEAEPGTA